MSTYLLRTLHAAGCVRTEIRSLGPIRPREHVLRTKRAQARYKIEARTAIFTCMLLHPPLGGVMGEHTNSAKNLKHMTGTCSCYIHMSSCLLLRKRLLRLRLSRAARPLLAAAAKFKRATLAALLASKRLLLGRLGPVWRRLLRRARHAHADVMQMHVPKKLALQRLCSKKLALQRTQRKRLVASAATPARRRALAAGTVRRRVLLATRRVARRASRAAAIIALSAASPVSMGRGWRRHAGAPATGL